MPIHSQKLGNAKETPALIHREDFGDHILPAYDDQSCPKRARHRAQRRLPGLSRQAGRQKYALTEQQHRQAFGEKPMFTGKNFSAGALNHIGCKQLRQQVARRADHRDQAINSGLSVKWLTYSGRMTARP
jgi:hypothetical protein